jgi:hypothetical protein
MHNIGGFHVMAKSRLLAGSRAASRRRAVSLVLEMFLEMVVKARTRWRSRKERLGSIEARRRKKERVGRCWKEQRCRVGKKRNKVVAEVEESGRRVSPGNKKGSPAELPPGVRGSGEMQVNHGSSIWAGCWTRVCPDCLSIMHPRLESLCGKAFSDWWDRPGTRLPLRFGGIRGGDGMGMAANRAPVWLKQAG